MPFQYDPAVRVIVLGAGFAGLELTTRLSDELGDDLDVLLIDGRDGFVFGFPKLDVMFAGANAPSVHHRYRDFVKPGVRFVQAMVTAIDLETKRVKTTAGTFDADVLVVCLGADLDPAATPGLLKGGHEFYTEEGAFALRDVLAAFEGGRVVVAVTSTPFKCPPAPSETVLLLHEFLRSRSRSRPRPRRRRPYWSPSRSAPSSGIPTRPCGRSIRRAASLSSTTAGRCPTTSSSLYPCTGPPRWSSTPG